MPSDLVDFPHFRHQVWRGPEGHLSSMLLLGMVLVNISCGAEKVMAEKMLDWWSFSSCAIRGKWVQLAENCGFCFRSHAAWCVTKLFGLTLTSYGSLDSATFTKHYKGRPLLPNIQSVTLSCCLLFFICLCSYMWTELHYLHWGQTLLNEQHVSELVPRTGRVHINWLFLVFY